MTTLIQPVFLAASSLLNCLGAGVKAVNAAVSAQISGFQDSSIYDRHFNPLKLASIPPDALPPLDASLDAQPLAPRVKRLLQIAHNSLLQMAALNPAPTPLFLATPAPHPAMPASLEHNLLPLLQAQIKFPLDLANSKLFPFGRAGGAYALQAAMEYLAQNDCEEVLVGGLDSYVDINLLYTLSEEKRLLTAANSQGFIPGEGCVFLRISKTPTPGAACIYPPGLAFEPGHKYSDQPYRGEGLHQAFLHALSHLPQVLMQRLYWATNGEAFDSKEFGVAQIRNRNRLLPDAPLHHPADCWGDLGAAAFLSLLTIASEDKNQTALIFGASDGSHRGAVVITT